MLQQRRTAAWLTGKTRREYEEVAQEGERLLGAPAFPPPSAPPTVAIFFPPPSPSSLAVSVTIRRQRYSCRVGAVLGLLPMGDDDSR